MEFIRPCTFCNSSEATAIGHRLGTDFVRCKACGSIGRNIDRHRFDRLHDSANTSDTYAARIVSSEHERPSFDRWQKLRLPGQRVLEIGPGCGHLLAAAAADGRSVTGVETSAIHRDVIRSTWGIESLYPDLDALPNDSTFDAIVALNVLEHVYDIVPVLRSIRQHLTASGSFFFTMPNADALVRRMTGVMWSMFKDADHVSFPSEKGVRLAAARAGLQVDRFWTDEMAMETPACLAVALRDRIYERRAQATPTEVVGGGSAPALSGHLGGRGTRALAVINRSRFATYEPTRAICARLGRAGSVRAVLRLA